MSANDSEYDIEIIPQTDRGKLMHDQDRLYYISNVLRFADKLTKDHSKDDELEYFNRLNEMLNHYTTSGGSGSEAITQLIGLGVMDEFPQIKFLKVFSADTPFPDGTIEISNTKKGKTIIDATVYFLARVPDETGRETWKYPWVKKTICESRIVLTVPDGGLNELVNKYTSDFEAVTEKVNQLTYRK